MSDWVDLVPRGFTETPAVRVLPGTRSHLGLPYAWPSGFRPLRLDLHLPPWPGPHPVVVYAHGGSWLGGVPGYGPWHTLPSRGIAVASVGYRLSGEVGFPAPVEDVRAAVRWVRAHGGPYGLDPGRVAGWGSSAGSYLMTLVAVTASLGEVVGDGLGSAGLDAVVAHYGPTDLDALRGSGVVEALLRDRPAADPVALAGPAAPPFLLVHGDADSRVPVSHSARLHEALPRSELVVLPGADHADPVFFARPEVDRVCEFLSRCGGRSSPRPGARAPG